MIPEYELAEAYDALNLPRGATKGEVENRMASLIARATEAGNLDRLAKVKSAHELIIQAESMRKLAVDSSGNRTRSERALDEELERVTKKAKIDQQDPPQPLPISTSEKSPSSLHTDSELLFKIRSALLHEDNFLRTGKLLSSILQDPSRLSPSNFNDFLDTIVCLVNAPCYPFTYGSRYCSSTKESRDVVELVIQRLEAQAYFHQHDAASMKYISNYLQVATKDTFGLLSDDSFVFSSSLKRIQDILEEGEEEEGEQRKSLVPKLSEAVLVALQALLSPEITSVPSRKAQALKLLSDAYRLSPHREQVADIQRSMMRMQ